MSARATNARNVFRRSLNPWLKPKPSGPINKNQPPKRKTGINTTLDRFHKLIVELNQKNAKLCELIENMERLQNQEISQEEEEIIYQNAKEEEKKILINDFHTSLQNHRRSLERRLAKLNEIEESLGIFRFDEPKPKPPKVEYPPVNPNIPSPRAHLRTNPRFDLANSISKTENDQLTEKALYLERLIIVQKMKLKLCHDHRELAKLSKELEKVETSDPNDPDFHATEPTSPRTNSGRNFKNPRARILRNSHENSANISCVCEEEESGDEAVSVDWVNANSETNNINDNGNNNNDNEENNEGEFDDDIDFDDFDFEEAEDQKLKDNIIVLKAAIEHEKKRIKQYKSKYYRFYEAAVKIQKVWRGYNYRLKNKTK
ncbi:hypothetical protein M9Y10_028568 [Tritrichomonas musculus]|uniref:Uncharacterized protein n=1 Tax=Tritrichomonas musculus TaxID=1915356 RepID=A0ABR2KJR5_9EUKA